MAIVSTTKRKRVSKKSKLSWRKHVNIRDVEAFLEDKRLEERLGKPVSERTNEELFQVDTTPTNQHGLTSKQAKRLMIRQKLPKCYSILQPHTQVPDPVVKRNRVKTKEERKNELIKKKEKVRKEQGILKEKELQSLKDRKSYEMKKANQPKSVEFQVDVWNHENDTNSTLLSDPWIAFETKQHTLRGIGKMPKIVPKSVTKKNSILQPVENPHPGTSYNPTFGDHQELLQHVAVKENKIIEVEKHLLRVTKSMFRKVTAAEKDNSWLVEMSEGLPSVPTGNDEMDSQDMGDYTTGNPPVQNKKKNLKQRRKLKEQKKLDQSRLLAKKEKKKIADIYKLKFLKLKLEKIDRRNEILRQKRKKKNESKSKEAKRLGALKFEDEEIDFNMPQDITGNLRNIRKEGNLLLNRFKSLQKRNILQPTTKRTRKQAKVKRFQKPGHKDDWKTTVARATN